MTPEDPQWPNGPHYEETRSQLYLAGWQPQSPILPINVWISECLMQSNKLNISTGNSSQ